MSCGFRPVAAAAAAFGVPSAAEPVPHAVLANLPVDGVLTKATPATGSGPGIPSVSFTLSTPPPTHTRPRPEGPKLYVSLLGPQSTTALAEPVTVHAAPTCAEAACENASEATIPSMPPRK